LDTARPSDHLIASSPLPEARTGVGLSFYYGATLPDPRKLLLGGGSQNRFSIYDL
jgi:hypothetical protein